MVLTSQRHGANPTTKPARAQGDAGCDAPADMEAAVRAIMYDPFTQ